MCGCVGYGGCIYVLDFEVGFGLVLSVGLFGKCMWWFIVKED